MKADLNKILAALQQLEQNPHSGSRPFVTSSQDPIADSTAEATSKAAKSSSSSVPIPPLKPHQKAPTLPPFNSGSAENAPDAPSLVMTPLLTLREELQQIIQQITNLYVEGPIVDGWLESYPCESIPRDDEKAFNDVARPLEYVKAARSLTQDNVVCEAPRSCYRLNGVSTTGQQWSYPCPMEQLPSVSVAIARYEKLLQLVDRKWDLETRLKQS